MNKNNIKLVKNVSEITEDLEEFYVSVDIEATGPIPGMYSMSSIGAFVSGARTRSGEYIQFDHSDRKGGRNENNIFYAELKPISENFDKGAIKVGVLEGFDKAYPNNADEDGSLRHRWMIKHGQDPKSAVKDFALFVNNWRDKLEARPVFMAYPASFDWTFVYWYFRFFDVVSPFGFSGVLDLKTYFSAKFDKPLLKSTKRYMPKHLFSNAPHTHRADDDAIEQGIMGMNILSDSGE